MNFIKKDITASQIANNSSIINLILEYDWATTKLGDFKSWPGSLKSTLNLCCDMNIPASIFWGRDCIHLYNNAWKEFIGDQQTSTLGKPAYQVFTHSWQSIKPQVEHVFSTGSSVHIKNKPSLFEDQDINHYRHFDYALSPIRDDNQKVVGILNIAIETKSLKEREIQFRRAIEDAPIPVILHTEDGEVLQVSKSWMTLTGYSMGDTSIFKTWLSKAYGSDRKNLRDAVRKIFETGEKISFEDIEIQTKDGENRFWNFSASSPGRLEDGRRYIVGMALDITERKKSEKTQRLLLGELNHRVKNTLATIQAIASQTLKKTDNPEIFFQSFNGRLKALAIAHSLLTKASWEGSFVREIINEQLVLNESTSGKIKTDGPKVFLKPQPALHLALILHELGTNAYKYGALSSSEGSVSVNWKLCSIDGQSVLKLIWIEQNGPIVIPPEITGFGKTLIEHSLRGVRGKTKLLFEETGVICEIILPITEIVNHKDIGAGTHEF